jgi:DNA-binding transcriptional MerR regulator
MPPFQTDQTTRDAVLAIYQAEGLAAAWRQTGVPKPTIRYWAKQAGIDPSLVTQGRLERTEAAIATAEANAHLLRRELRQQLLERALDVLSRMDAVHQEFAGRDGEERIHNTAPAQAVRDYAITAGILIDKLRLEEGSATSRAEQVSAGMNDAERATLRDAIQKHLATRPDAGPPDHGSADQPSAGAGDSVGAVPAPGATAGDVAPLAAAGGEGGGQD